MTIRASGLAAALAVVMAGGLAAQRVGTIEIGAFARVTEFDRSLGLDQAMAVGGRATVFLRPGLAFEVDVSHTAADHSTGGGSVSYTPVHARLVGVLPVGARSEVLVGGGYVRNSYGGPLGASDGGVSGVLGLSRRLTDRIAVRAGFDADVMFHTAAGGPFNFYTGNWGLQLGASARL